MRGQLNLDRVDLYEWGSLFKRIVIQLKQAPVESKTIRKTRFLGDIAKPLVVQSYRLSGIHLEVSHLFSDAEDSRYASREKLHIQQLGLNTLENFLSSKDIEFLSGFFNYVSSEMELYQDQALLNEASSHGHYQLLLIHYSASQSEYCEELTHLSDQIFGEPHQDETLFSFHFGEIGLGLELFNNLKCDWYKPTWENRPIVLIGQEGRALGLTPTSHRVATDDPTKSRFSLIMEKIGVFEEISFVNASTLRRKHSFQRQKSTAIIIWDLDKSQTNWASLVRQQIDVHLYTYRRARGGEVLLASSLLNDPDFNALIDAETAVVFEPGFMVRSEDELNYLHSLYERYPDLLFYYFEPHLKLPGMTLINLSCPKPFFRQVLQSRPGKVRDQYPNHRWQEKISESYCSQYENLNQQLIIEEKNLLEDHIKRGFSKIFLFNTEPYVDIDLLPTDVFFDAVVGLASGFKTFFLAARYLENKPKIYMLDMNDESLKFWKYVWEHWDGRNFPQWLSAKNFSPDGFYQWKNSESLWEDELDKWGGAKLFQETWTKLKECKISFHQQDFLHIENFVANQFTKEQKVVFWMSNVWDNEYTLAILGDEYLRQLYSFLQALDSHKSDFHLLGSPIFLKKIIINIDGQRPNKILKEIDAFKS
jgi:hypothetical protein